MTLVRYQFAALSGDPFVAAMMCTIAEKETGYLEPRGTNPYTVINSIKAAGRYQFMPGTWKGWGGAGASAHTASAVEQDRVAAKAIGAYRQKYGDNVRLIAIAWHAGPGVADKARTGRVSAYDTVAGISTEDYAAECVTLFAFWSSAAGVAKRATLAPIGSGRTSTTGTTQTAPTLGRSGQGSSAGTLVGGTAGATVPAPQIGEAPRLLTPGGFGLDTLADVFTAGTVDLDMDSISEVRLSFYDPGLRFASVTKARAGLKWGNWPLEVAAFGSTPGAHGTGLLTLELRDALGQQLKRNSPGHLSYPKRSVSELLAQVVGLDKLVAEKTPSLDQITINTSEDTGEPEFWWDAIQRFAQDTTMTGNPGFKAWVSAGVLYFGRPSWLVERMPVLSVKVGFASDGQVVLDDGHDAMPTVRVTDGDPDIAAELTLTVRPELGVTMRPGMAVALDMAAYPGLYMVAKVGGDVGVPDPWQVVCVLPRNDVPTQTATVDEYGNQTMLTGPDGYGTTKTGAAKPNAARPAGAVPRDRGRNANAVAVAAYYQAKGYRVDGFTVSAAHHAANPNSDHDKGDAIDIHVSGTTADRVRAEIISRAKEWGVKYTINKSHIYNDSDGFAERPYEGRFANGALKNPHNDHIHVSFHR